MPRAGLEPEPLTERLLEFDKRSKPLGHHGRFFPPPLLCYIIHEWSLTYLLIRDLVGHT